MNPCTITSSSNELIKMAKALHSSKRRKEFGMHLAEGEKTIQEAVSSGFVIEYLFCEDSYDYKRYDALARNISIIPRDLMLKISDSDTPQNVCAVIKTPYPLVINESMNGPFLVLDCVQDPGNVGTMIRTADAFGINNILIGKGTADPYSPKTLRSAMGSTYHVSLAFGNCVDEAKKLKKGGYTLICGHLKGEETFPSISDMNKAAIIVGNEGNGVSTELASLCYLYRIPMKGKTESLNASIATAILLYEFQKNL